MRKKICWMLALALILTLAFGTAALAVPNTGVGNAQPTKPQTGYPQYPDEYYDTYGGSSNDSTVTLEVVGDMGLRVLVTETDGVTPIEGAGVKIVTVSSGALLAAVTNEYGIAFIELPRPGLGTDGLLKPEEYIFSVEKEGYLPQEDISVSFDGHTVEKHVMLERAAQEFTIFVTNQNGVPVEGATVALSNAASGSETGSGVTDKDGKLVLTLPVAKHSFVVMHQDYLRKAGTLVCTATGGTETIVLDDKTYKATVRVVDKDTGEGILGVMVKAADGSRYYTNKDGTILFEGGELAAGPHKVTLTKTGYVALRNYTFVIERHDDQEILIEMQSTAKNITPDIVPGLTPGGGETGGSGGGGTPLEAAAGGDLNGTPTPLSATRSVKRTVDVETCVMNPDGSYIEGAALEFLPEGLKLSTDETGRVVFHGAAIGKHTVNAEKDKKRASLEFEIMTGDELDLIDGDPARVVITDDMETLTLFLEFDGDGLRLAGLTKKSMQDDQLENVGGAMPYAENAVLDQDKDGGLVPEAGKKMVLAETGLLWMLLALLVILGCCVIAAYVYKREQKNAMEAYKIN